MAGIILAFLEFFAESSGCLEKVSKWPQVSFVGVVGPDVIEAVVQTGTVIPARQEPYVPQPGDRVAR
jgi:hypothetical protein